VSHLPTADALTPELLRAWAWHRQGLDAAGEARLAGAAPAAVLEATGWARSVGGASPYLSLFARAGLRRADVDAAVGRLDVHELPSVRGCTYIVPAPDHAFALALGTGGAEAALRVLDKLGVARAEIEALQGRVVETLAAHGPLTPAELRERLGDAVRSLGEVGKKKGASTTLPAALGALQSTGALRRVPLDGRLDRQRYAYAVWGLPRDGSTPAELDAAILERHLRWSGGATREQTRWFTGLTVARTRAALRVLGAVEGPAATGETLWMLPHDAAQLAAFRPEPEGRVRLLAGLDSLFLLRRNPADFVDAVDVERGVTSGANLLAADLEDHPIVRDGRIVGLWQFDPSAGDGGEIVAWVFAPGGADERAATAAEIERTQAWIREDLGDFRSFSLDSPASRITRIVALRARA